MLEQQFIDKIRELILPFLDQQRIELVELNFRRQGTSGMLKFLVEKAGGITLEDCIFLNQEISAILDQHPDILAERYILEVSSPGLDRPLTSDRDFVRAMGKEVQVFLKEAWEGKFEYQGEVEDVIGQKLWLKESDGGIIQIPLEVIQKGKRKI